MKNIIFFLMILFSITLPITELKAQDPWIRVIGSDYYNTTPYSVRETYDNGYLLHYRFQVSSISQTQTRLMKTNVNGSTALWQKTFGTVNGNTVNIMGLDETPDGGLILYGDSYNFTDNNSSVPFIMKLNACMDKEWCKIDTSVNSYAMNAIALPDGNFIVSRTELGVSIIHIITKLDPSGKTIWKKQFGSSNPDYDAGSMLLSYCETDNTLLLRGTIGMNVPPDSMSQSRPYISKITTDGESLWEFYTIPDSAHNNVMSGFEMAVHPSGNITIPLYKPFEGSELLNVNQEGEFMSVNTLSVPDSVQVSVNSMESIDEDRVIFSVQSYLNNGNPLNTSLLITTNNGVILKETVVDANLPVVVYDISRTSDNKILYLKYNNDGGFSFVKLNENMEYDSIYNISTQYDSNCDHQIESSEITLDCSTYGIIDKSPLNLNLKLSPNPTSDYLAVRLPDMISVNEEHGPFNVITMNANYIKDLSLEIIDINGRSVFTSPWVDNTLERIINTSFLKKGMYLVRLYNSTGLVSQGKFFKL